MKKSVIFACFVVLMFGLSLSFASAVTLSDFTDLSALQPQLMNIVLSALFFVLFFAVIGVSAMVNLKKPFVYGGIAVASLFPILFLGFTPAVAILSAGIFLGCAIYYVRTQKIARNMIHFSPFISGETAIPLSLTVIVLSATIAVFFSSSGVPISELIPDQFIDLSVGMLGSQVEQLGCSLSMTIGECVESQVSRQIEPQTRQLYQQCEPLSGTPQHSVCMEEVENQIDQMTSEMSDEFSDELMSTFGAQSTDQTLREVAREMIRSKVLEIIAPAEPYIPFALAAIAITFLGGICALIKPLIPLVIFLMAKVLIAEGFLKIKKEKREVDILV